MSYPYPPLNSSFPQILGPPFYGYPNFPFYGFFRSLYRVEYKIPGVTRFLQRLSVLIPAFNEAEAAVLARQQLPPFAQITRIRRRHP